LELCGQPKSIAELGISEEAFKSKLPELVALAFNDLSLRTNPSILLQVDMAQLFIDSFAPRSRP
jgi:alcohol dehydrogenase class IV